METPGFSPRSFHYVYAVIYSNAYRKKYAEFLKKNFPRVPFTANHTLFSSLADKGAELVDLHLLASRKLEKPIARCEGAGGLVVQRPMYDKMSRRVYINASLYFAPVPKNVWEYHVGGYQVAEKWLKDRKGRTLSSEDVSHYCKVLTALAETIEVQKSLDVLFKSVEGAPLEAEPKFA